MSYSENKPNFRDSREVIKEQLADQERLERTGGRPSHIGEYQLQRLFNIEDIYNSAFIEEDRHYIIDKEGVKHLICITNAGVANKKPSSINEINRNKKLLKDIVYAVVMSESKSPLTLFGGKKVKAIVERLEECIEYDDFSTFYIDDLKSGTTDKIFEQFEKDSKDDYYKFFQKTNVYPTEEQMKRGTFYVPEERGM